MSKPSTWLESLASFRKAATYASAGDDDDDDNDDDDDDDEPVPEHGPLGVSPQCRAEVASCFLPLEALPEWWK